MKDETVSPWRDGRLGGGGAPILLFGRMHEDFRIELEAFPPAGRVFCIASAGCTAFALSESGHQVRAVDVNPAQVSYVRQRLTGAPHHHGRIDELMARGRRFLSCFGMRRARLRSFLELSDPKAQQRFWRTHLDTRRWRAALSVALHPLALRRVYAPSFLSALPRPFAPVLRRRLERGWATHPNRGNPYAWRMLLGEDPPRWRAPTPRAERLNIECADAADYLEGCRPGSFDGFSLSNVLDAASMAYRERLHAAVRHAARPGAVVVLRSFSEPEEDEAGRRAARDRSLLWGSIRIHVV